MTKKYYWVMAVAAAFVAGTMTTGGVVYASFDQCNNNPPMGLSDGKPFLEIWAAICDLESAVDGIDSHDRYTDAEAVAAVGIESEICSIDLPSVPAESKYTAECTVSLDLSGTPKIFATQNNAVGCIDMVSVEKKDSTTLRFDFRNHCMGAFDPPSQDIAVAVIP